MFNESEYIKLLFLLADTQKWLNEMSNELFMKLPIDNKKKLLGKTYRLTTTALAHIIERHYYKIPRHPGTGKFHIPVTGILHYIREAACLLPIPVPGTFNQQRIIRTPEPIGYDKNGQPASTITILTDPGGMIITAFPGTLQNI